ncbi:9207_t:CDS:2, partial [Rhizophagus irregularis]
SAPQQHGIFLEDMQKAIQNALAQQKTENQTLIKKVTELQSQMTQQAQVSALQTVEPVRQPRGPPSSLQTEEGLKNYYASEYLKEIGVLNKAKLDADYLVKPFQRPRQQRNNNSARIDRMEEGLNETRDAVNELRGISHKLAGNTNAISPSKSSQPKTYDELLPKLLPAMRKMCLSQNLRTVEALEWKVNKPSKFAVKGNSKYISEALGWYTNVAVTLKNMKGNPIITIVGNYACVDNGITEIRKVKSISDPIKNQFCIEDHEKTYIISTFSKFLIVKDLPKKEQDQVSTNSSSLTGKKDLKKVQRA